MKNSRIKSKESPSGMLGTYVPDFVIKKPPKKVKTKKGKDIIKRDTIKKMNNQKMDFNKRGKR